MFLFQFVNNYFVLFYISIIRPFYHSCEKELELPAGNGTYIDTSMCVQSDLAELQFQLMVVFTGKSVGQSLAEMLKPKLRLFIKRRLLEDKLVKQILERMDDFVDSIDDLVDFDGDSDEDIDAVNTGMVQHRMTTTASGSQAAQSAGLTDDSRGVSEHEVRATPPRETDDISELFKLTALRSARKNGRLLHLLSACRVSGCCRRHRRSKPSGNLSMR